MHCFPFWWIWRTWVTPRCGGAHFAFWLWMLLLLWQWWEVSRKHSVLFLYGLFILFLFAFSKEWKIHEKLKYPNDQISHFSFFCQFGEILSMQTFVSHLPFPISVIHPLACQTPVHANFRCCALLPAPPSHHHSADTLNRPPSPGFVWACLPSSSPTFPIGFPI